MLRLTSKTENILRLEKYLNSILSEYQVAPEIYPNILISLTEAVNNAIRHGNMEDESKFVCIKQRRRNDALVFWVSDEGCGFDPSDVPDPTLPENLEQCGGRGVFIMRNLCDRLRYKENGRTVELEFKLR